MFRKRRLFFNAVTMLPGVSRLSPVKRILKKRVTGTGGSISARYCYSIWLRHLVLAARSGLNTNPRTVAELGPGDSLGVGLAALLSGSSMYLAFDVVAHANVRRNVEVLDALVDLFRSNAAIPGDDEFPEISPKLDNYKFPSNILTEERLRQSLDPLRIAQIRDSLNDDASSNPLIQYRAPWLSERVLEPESIDMIFSQAVLEHVDDLGEVYRTMRRWLMPSGFMSHQVDLKSHGWAVEWNGHWAHSDLMWKLIRGKDSWFINRAPASIHLELLREGFNILRFERETRPSNIEDGELCKRFKSISQLDLTTSGIFFQATKTQAV